jgi:DNA-binding response OmpR family regulator
LSATDKRRALVVEDEVLVAMLVEEMLQELGYEIAALSPHLDVALRLARTLDYDFALLDINLNGELSFPVADAIRGRGRPFLFTTGYGNRILSGAYVGAPLLQKPFSQEELKAALERLGV